MNAPLSAPAEVPTITSGSTPRSYRASSIPTWIDPRLAPPESTNAVAMAFLSSTLCSRRSAARPYPVGLSSGGRVGEDERPEALVILAAGDDVAHSAEPPLAFSQVSYENNQPGLVLLAAVCKTREPMIDVPTPSDDVLAQPTRARLFRVLGEMRRPAPT